MGDTYRIDKDGSQFTIHVTAEGLLSKFGHDPIIAIRDFEGEVHFDPVAPEDSSLSMTIRVESLEVTSTNIVDKDRREIEQNMKKDVLRANVHSSVRYETLGVSAAKLADDRYRLNLDGELELRGVTRNQALSAQLTVSDDQIKGSGEFKLKQSNFGIKQYKALGGALKVKDEVTISFNILARKGGSDEN